MDRERKVVSTDVEDLVTALTQVFAFLEGDDLPAELRKLRVAYRGLHRARRMTRDIEELPLASGVRLPAPMQNPFPSITSQELETTMGGKDPGKPGKIAKAVYGGMVAASILAGSPGGQRHDDRSSGPLHSTQATSTSQAK